MSQISPVIVYSSNACPNCEQLKKALGIKGIPFEEINVVEQPEAANLLREKGMRKLPVINDNDEWMMGFTPTNFNKIVQAHSAPSVTA